ncbi:gamma-glutamyl hydrolase-like [Stylonychia lemnae]|uniref:folate gamma-glutamyl hydrolase n=1 Tax=Stylonychia lemnae TaxID=5949 RepID=A0A078A9K3_STYLE|nr:gamma-glutamyl hydrolase-like [Stylonychia lemnae]|eukprot:CDW78272.1 gamma-glutamyl hydrolase-like [Stylonychia lemnae]
MFTFFLVTFFLGLCEYSSASRQFLKLEKFQQERPVIGIVTVPGQKESFTDLGKTQYIFEMNEVFMSKQDIDSVFIPYNINDKDLYEVLQKINGVFFTGGDVDLYDEKTGELHIYTITSQKIFHYALNQTDNGDYYPIIGICQGIELLHIIVANNTQALGWSKYENKRANTQINHHLFNSSRLLQSLTSEVLHTIQQRDILYHLHHRGIPVKDYERFEKLADFFHILSTNIFEDQEIVSTAEAKNYPIYVFQYHPEVVYEPTPDINSDKSRHSVTFAHQLTSFFKAELLKNNHRFESEEDIDQIRVRNGFKGKTSYVQDFANTFGFDY